MSNLGFQHYSGLKGSNYITVGNNADVFNYTSLVTAIAEADNYQTILVAPGEYTLTATLSIVKPLTIIGMGGPNDTIITSALATRTVMLNVPAYAHGTSVTNNFVNIKFANTSTGDCIEIDNDGGAAQDFYVNFEDCSFITAAGVGIDLDQTTETKDMFVTVTGKPCFHSLAASTFDQEKAGSTLTIRGMYCTGVFAFDTVAVASIFNMIQCIYMSDAQTTGGDAAKLHNLAANVYGVAGLSGAVTAGLANDFDATSTEAFITLA